MEMKFTDGVLDVAITGSLARIDFFLLRPGPGTFDRDLEHPALQHEVSFSVAMPIEAFAQASTVFENVRKKLVESGTLKLVTRTEKELSDSSLNGSPNFPSEPN